MAAIFIAIPVLLPSQPQPGSLVATEMTPAQLRKAIRQLKAEIRNRQLLDVIAKKRPEADRDYLEKKYGVRRAPELQALTLDQLELSVKDVEFEFNQRAIMYGGDDIKDIFETPPGATAPDRPVVTDAEVLDVASSVVAIVHRDSLEFKGGSWVLATGEFNTVNSGYGLLCEYERFYNAPVTHVAGTGFLIEQDVIATAGHVVNGDEPDYQEFLDDVYFLFGYVMESEDVVKTLYSADDVYEGEEVLGRRVDDADWALIKLDRAVVGRTPLPYRKTGKMEDAADVYMIGHPNGMPQKYSGPADVNDNSTCYYFRSLLDTYAYNSGSPVINSETHVVEGVLVRDFSDFQKFCDCYATKTYSPEMGSEGAEATRTTSFAGWLAMTDNLVVVQCEIPVGSFEYAGDVVVLVAGDEVSLPFSTSGAKLLISESCYEFYYPQPWEVWEIVSLGAADQVLMRPVCYP